MQKQKIDQEKEIEDEIQRELERSRIRRTESKADKEKRNIITHHPRYVESTREPEKEYIDPYYRGATYDVVNRNINQYPEVDDSYVIQTKPERVERFTERNFNPGVAEVDARAQVRSPIRKSTVNPQYRDQYNVAVGDNRAGTAYRTEGQGIGSGRSGSGGYISGGDGRIGGRTTGEPQRFNNEPQRFNNEPQRYYNEPQNIQRRSSEFDDYDSEQDYKAKSIGSNKNLRQEIIGKKMKEEKDNRKYDDDFI